jgi:hypothetical protein
MTADGLKCTFTGDSVPGLDFTEKDDHGSANLDMLKANGKLCNDWPTGLRTYLGIRPGRGYGGLVTPSLY